MSIRGSASEGKIVKSQSSSLFKNFQSERERVLRERCFPIAIHVERERERKEMEDIQEEENGTDEEVLGSSLTMEKVAAAKQYIENHYKAQNKNIQERKERYYKSSLSLRERFEIWNIVFWRD